MSFHLNMGKKLPATSYAKGYNLQLLQIELSPFAKYPLLNQCGTDISYYHLKVPCKIFHFPKCTAAKGEKSLRTARNLAAMC